MSLTIEKPVQKISLLLAIAAIVIGATFIVAAILRDKTTVAAVSKDDWMTGNIISDANFTDKNSMSAADIQNFLDSKITCDIQGTGKATEWGSNLTRAQYAASRGWPGPPYTCLNKYYEVPKTVAGGSVPANNYSNPSAIPAGAQSAAWIIKDAANRYNISPKVLLVKIATESVGPLTSDNWPFFSQYRYAMGAHCPDSGAGGSANCDPAYAGFSIQIYSAAQLMRNYLDGMDQSWWPYKRPGSGVDRNGTNSNYVGWTVAARGCGGTVIDIQNKATAALYTYTPYQPNSAALNNMYGSGDNCSSYGNRNFWSRYWDWFGTSRGPAYAWQELSQKIYTSDEKTTEIDYNNVGNAQYVYIEYTVKNTGSATWPKGSVLLGRGSNSPLCISEWIACSRATIANKTADVKPNETTTFGFWMRTPQTAGSYSVYWNLLIENVSWFADIGSHHNITVKTKTIPDRLDSSTPFMKLGDSLYSPDKLNSLTLLSTGNLSIYRKGALVKTIARGVHQLRQQGDSNLVAYSKTGTPLWAIGDGQSRQLSISNDGKLNYKINANDVGLVVESWDVTESRFDSLKAESLITQDQALVSDNKLYSLILQRDGNLVQYGPKGPMWSTGYNMGSFLIQQGDGKLVLYDYAGKAIWSSNTWLADGSKSFTIIQGDGNLVTYNNFKPVWDRR